MTAPLERETSGDLLAVDRDLSWFVWANLSQELPVWFGDVSTAAILGAQLIHFQRATEGGSSPEHTAIEIVTGRR